MSQRVNRAFYSEPLLSFPGRLHITAEKSYIEVLIRENGSRSFRTFSIEEDYTSLINLLIKQDFYQDGYELAYERELFEVSNKAKRIQDYLFKDTRHSSQQINQKNQLSVPKKDNRPKEQVVVPKDVLSQSESETNISKELLGNIVGSVINYIICKQPSEKVIELSPSTIVMPEQPLFEQEEYDDVVVPNITEENVSAMTSKYIGKFSNLHIPKKNGRYALDKAILLMSVISMFDGSNKHQGSTIHCNSQLRELFDSKWEKYCPNTPHDDIRKTFLTMSDESFWHLNPPTSNGEYSAQIDSGLAVTLSQQRSRSLLRKTLYSRYFK